MSRARLPVRYLPLLLVLAAAIIPVAETQGKFIAPQLVNVPVAQLIKNLEQMVLKAPKDATLKFNLARVHAMAFALKTDETKIWNGKEKDGAWFGYTPKVVPFTVKKTDDPAKEKEAKEHLDKALEIYAEVTKLDPKHLPALLGHAWLVEQSGNKMKAIDEYRKVIDKAWAKEGELKSGPIGGNYITVEAAGYLIPLLNKDTDKAEIQTLTDRTAQLKKLPRPVTPIAVPLRDGLKASDLLDRNARVRFDVDGTGLDRRWTWITKDAAWLVYDPNHTRQIKSGLQLFGNVTFWLFWDNGYQALQALDNNGDGYLTGPELAGLALWHDVNGNGICEPGEVKSLAECGIVKISCRCITDSSNPNCAAWAPQGVWFADGTVRPTYDLILRRW
jgi:hypothetical protein